jgi:hypothetical protein
MAASDVLMKLTVGMSIQSSTGYRDLVPGRQIRLASIPFSGAPVSIMPPTVTLLSQQLFGAGDVFDDLVGRGAYAEIA